MGRTNVVLDDKLIARVMRLYGLRTKREAIDFALRSVAGSYDPKKLLALEGIGWEGDLAKMRGTRYPRW
ncbi:MAG: type II toxin-antitoxin system VapB family antitoxin [Candidatus Limnocylindria bacterium]